jgi:ribosomal subunit interface protein
MNIEIRSRDATLSAEVREHAASKMQTALDRFTPSIAQVTVGLEDANGPKGGVDKTCRIMVRGKAAWSVIVSDVDADPYTAIDRAGDRVGQAVSRVMERNRSHEKATLRRAV